jgi:hypothetical protein
MSELQLIVLLPIPPPQSSSLKSVPMTSPLPPMVKHEVPFLSISIHFTIPLLWNTMLPSSHFHQLSMSMEPLFELHQLQLTHLNFLLQE